MNTERPDPTWPEWVICQDSACVFVQAPIPEAAVETAARRIGPMGGWRIGTNVANEVFARDEYPEHAQPDRTHSTESDERAPIPDRHTGIPKTREREENPGSPRPAR